MIIGIALVSMIIAIISMVFHLPGDVPNIEFEPWNMVLCILAGVIWSLGNIFILSAISKIGISRTFPLVNLVVVGAFISGIIFLGELRSVDFVIMVMLVLAIASVLIGSVFTTRATSKEEKEIKDVRGGLIAAALSAVFFGFYNVPVLASLRSETWSPYMAVFFLSIGTLLGAVIFGFIWLRKKFFIIWRRAVKKWHLFAVSGGMIWGVGQVCAIIGMTYVGVSIGAPMIQGVVIVVGAVWGLLVFKELKDIPQKVRRKAGYILLFGCAFALIGSLTMGYVSSILF